MKTINKNTQTSVLEPVEIDAYFKYVCRSCGCSHWASQKEVSQSGFIIVCDCNVVIKPRNIKDLTPNYLETKTKKRRKNRKKKQVVEGQVIEPIDDEEFSLAITEKKPVHNEENINGAIKVLIGYGYEEKEASNMIYGILDICVDENISNLVKTALKNIGKNHEYFYNQTYEF